MTCEQRTNLILKYAADALNDGDAQEIRNHLAQGCPRCAATLAEAQAAITTLPLTLDPVAPPPQVRERLMVRAMANQNFGSSGRPTNYPISEDRTRSGAAAFMGWFRAGVAAAIAGAIVYVAVTQPLHKQIADLSHRLNSVQGDLTELQTQQVGSSKTLQILQSPAVQMVNLGATPVAPGAAARVFWDRNRNIWYVRATGLPALQPGRCYELWFFATGQKPVRSELFTPDSNSEASITAIIPRGMGAIAQAAITEEPAGGSNQPTSDPCIAGSVVQ